MMKKSAENSCYTEVYSKEACTNVDMQSDVDSLKKKTNCLFVLFAICALFTCSVVLGLVISRLNNGDGKLVRSPYTLCLPCENVTLSSPVENEFLKTISRDGSNDAICCASNSTEAGTMMERYFERKLRLEKARGTLCNGLMLQLPNASLCALPERGTTVAAHVLGNGKGIGSANSPMTWIHDEDMAYRYNVEYRNGRLVVPSTGVYYIYSQLYFVESPNGDNGQIKERDQLISHSIRRGNIYYNNGEHETLMQRSQTKCWAQDKAFQESSSYIGGALVLRAQDEIYVSTTAPSLVDPSPRQTFFGLYKTHA